MRTLVLPLAALFVLSVSWDAWGASKGSKSSHANPPKSQAAKPAKSQVPKPSKATAPKPAASKPKSDPGPVSSPVTAATTPAPAAVATPQPTVRVYRSYYGPSRRYRRTTVYRRGRGFVPRTDPVLVRLNRLAADIAAIGKGAVLSTDQRTRFQHDLTAVVDSPSKPQAGPVRQLAGDLADAVAHRTRSQLQTPAQLAYELKVVLNSPTVPASEVTTAMRRSESILKTAGVGLGAVQLVRSDLETLARR